MALVLTTGDLVVKRGIMVVSMLISLSCSAEWAAGAGGHWAKLGQQWQKVEAWQETKQKRWKAIEREAERMLKDLNSNEGVSQTKPRGKRH